jgi:long-chain acyl-CoA synthetase
VIGDRRPYVVALVVLEPTLAEGRSPDECEAQVQRAIDAGNAHLARVEQVKRFAIVPDEWLPGDDELTPTSKLKREPIAEKYATQMDALYS